MRFSRLRHRLLLGLAAFLVVTGAGASVSAVRHPAQAAPASPATHPPALRALFVGASITAGWYATRPQDAFPRRVAHLLGHPGRRVVLTVEARPGALVATVLSWSTPANQDVIVVHLATNDFSRATPLSVYRPRYGELLDRLRAESPNARLICLGTWAAPGAADRAGVPAVSYDDVVSEDCARVGGVFVPLSGVFADAGLHGPAGRPTSYGRADWFHPNDQGQLRIADVVASALATAPVPEPVTTTGGTLVS